MSLEEFFAAGAVVLRGVDCVDAKVVESVDCKLFVGGGSVNKINIGYASTEVGKTTVCSNTELTVYGFE